MWLEDVASTFYAVLLANQRAIAGQIVFGEPGAATLRPVHRAGTATGVHWTLNSLHQSQGVPAQTDTTPRLRIPLCGCMAIACNTLQRLF
jgi:hypothetical protein